MQWIQVYANLSNKYQGKFNFFFSKCINEIVYNKSTAVSTIQFKDAAIYAQTIEYLKRQYFVINEIGIQQIFQRINMLAGFYAGAVLLRYQYPSMVVTNTKEIFLKRLKRNRKMLTEEGSSDQSKVDTLSRQIQLHTNNFLDSVNSSQLSKKTTQLRDELFPQFKQNRPSDKSFDYSVHDIHNPSKGDGILVEKESLNSQQQQSFADKLMKLSKNISLNQMIDFEAIQINLTPVQAEVNHLICDFDEMDGELTIKNYEKLRIRDKKTDNPQPYLKSLYSDNLKDRSKMLDMPIDENGYYFNNEKTLQNPKYRRFPKQMRSSAMERQHRNRNSYYQSKENQKMYAFYPTRKSVYLDSSDERFGQLQESYKTLERFKSVIERKINENCSKHLYRDIQNRQRVSSYQQKHLQRHKSNKVINFKKDHNTYQPFNRQEQFGRHPTQIDPYKRRQNDSHFNQLKTDHLIQNVNYSKKGRVGYIQGRYVTQLQPLQSVHNQHRYHSPKFNDPKDQYKNRQEQGIPKCTKNILHINVRPSQINRSPYVPMMSQQNTTKRNQNNFEEQYVKYNQNQHQQVNYQEKQQKKKRIRQKAAQLLLRVKSQQYLTTRTQTQYIHSRY